MGYIIWCDESVSKGKYYSHFYGGALVKISDAQEVIDRLEAKKNELNIGMGEVKWTKITQNYQNKYIELIDCFFDLMKEGKVKVRIMFSDNRNVPIGLTSEQLDNQFFLLYYQFIKHAFGIMHVEHPTGSRLLINFDKLPDKKEKAEKLKSFLCRLSMGDFFRKVSIENHNLSEVDSKKHVVLQCTDIILGAMSFRLNKLHEEIPTGKRRRGKKTIAKEQVYKHINKKIRELYDGYAFNIGSNTGFFTEPGDITCRWAMPYRHWVFVPSECRREERE